MRMTIDYKNHGKIKERLQSLMPTGQRLIKRAVNREMESIQTDVQAGAPVRTGDLKETGHRHAATGSEVIEAEIGYGQKRKGFYAAPVDDKTKFLTKHARTKRIHEAVRQAMLKAGK